MEATMTMKKHAVNQLSCYGYNKFEDIPEEMLDYIPENMDADTDEDGTLSWDFDEKETPAEKLFI